MIKGLAWCVERHRQSVSDTLNLLGNPYQLRTFSNSYNVDTIMRAGDVPDIKNVDSLKLLIVDTLAVGHAKLFSNLLR